MNGVQLIDNKKPRLRGLLVVKCLCVIKIVDYAPFVQDNHCYLLGLLVVSDHP